MIPGGEPPLQVRVGAVMLLFILAAGVFVVVVRPRLGKGGVAIAVRFGNVGGLQEGAPVMQAGRTIGHVESITLDGADAEHAGALVRLRLARRYLHDVPVNAEVFVSSKGVLSSRYLELGPPPRGAPPGRPIEPGEPPLVGVEPPSLDRALQRTWDNLQQSRAFFEAVRPEAQALRASLEHLAQTLSAVEPAPGAYATLALRLGALAKGVGDLLDELEAAGADPAHLSALVDRARGVIADARASLAAVRTAAEPLLADLDRLRGAVGADAAARLRAALDQGEAMLAKADALLASSRALAELLARGEGSAFRLSRDPEFPEDAKELGKILKRNAWRILGHPVDDAPPQAPP
ncbi:MAG TPA: MlaD family protein [Kofleriaceae bacterium]|nr:MlaD family protein [Kofleriaceae bacterium]